MATFSPQSVTYTGVDITFTAASGIDTVLPGARRFLWVKNGAGVSTTVTIVVPGTTFLQNNPDISVNVAAGAETLFGPLDAGLGDPTNGSLIGIVIAPATSITVAAVDLPTPPPDLP